MLKSSNMLFLYYCKLPSNTIFSLSVLSKSCSMSISSAFLFLSLYFSAIMKLRLDISVMYRIKLFFHFFQCQWGGTFAQFTDGNTKTMFQLAKYVSKIILASVTSCLLLLLTVRKLCFFTVIEKASTNHNKNKTVF